jgi:hypothetical protein
VYSIFLPISAIFKRFDKSLAAKWLLLGMAAVETTKRALLDKADLSPGKTWSHNDKGRRMLRICSLLLLLFLSLSLLRHGSPFNSCGVVTATQGRGAFLER